LKRVFNKAETNFSTSALFVFYDLKKGWIHSALFASAQNFNNPGKDAGKKLEY
jgi:hypothetical protein